VNNAQDFLLSDLNRQAGDPAINTKGVPRAEQELWFEAHLGHPLFGSRRKAQMEQSLLIFPSSLTGISL
jgi:hypothetical protein